MNGLNEVSPVLTYTLKLKDLVLTQRTDSDMMDLMNKEEKNHKEIYSVGFKK